MATLKRYFRATKRRGGKRRKTGKARYRRRLRQPQIVPAAKVVKLRYVQQIVLDAAAGSKGAHVFRANSIFDPDSTGLGHQPLGHDQWVVFYDHYTVIGSRCTALFISNTAVVDTGTSMVGIALTDSNSVAIAGTPQEIMEQPTSSYKLLTNGAAIAKATVRKGFSAKRFFGLKDIKDNRTVVGASQGANPSDGAFFQVYQTALTTSQDPLQCRVLVTIEYTVLFTERKILGGS